MPVITLIKAMSEQEELKWGDLSADYEYSGYLSTGDDTRRTKIKMSISTGTLKRGQGVTLSITGSIKDQMVQNGVYFKSTQECREFMRILEKHLILAEKDRADFLRRQAVAEEYFQRSNEIDKNTQDEAERRRLKQLLRDELSLS